MPFPFPEPQYVRRWQHSAVGWQSVVIARGGRRVISALQASSYLVPVPTDELSYRFVKKGVDAQVKWGKGRHAPAYHEISPQALCSSLCLAGQIDRLAQPVYSPHRPMFSQGIPRREGHRLAFQDLAQVHPRRTNSTNNMGIGIPRAQSKIHPTFPFSLLSISILHFLMVLPVLSLL